MFGLMVNVRPAAGDGERRRDAQRKQLENKIGQGATSSRTTDREPTAAEPRFKHSAWRELQRLSESIPRTGQRSPRGVASFILGTPCVAPAASFFANCEWSIFWRRLVLTLQAVGCSTICLDTTSAGYCV